MQTVFTILIGVGAVSALVWLLIPSSTSDPETGGELIDPSDSRQIGLLIGMTGGDVTDAAVARFALQRFEEIHGRKPTTRDVGMVVGLMKGVDHSV